MDVEVNLCVHTYLYTPQPKWKVQRTNFEELVLFFHLVGKKLKTSGLATGISSLSGELFCQPRCSVLNNCRLIYNHW